MDRAIGAANTTYSMVQKAMISGHMIMNTKGLTQLGFALSARRQVATMVRMNHIRAVRNGVRHMNRRQKNAFRAKATLHENRFWTRLQNVLRVTMCMKFVEDKPQAQHHSCWH